VCGPSDKSGHYQWYLSNKEVNFTAKPEFKWYP
jgi:hypothetical protein